MASVTIVCFSGTGSTKKVAYSVLTHCETIGLVCEIIDVNTAARSCDISSDYLICVYPVYAGRSPLIIEEYIKACTFKKTIKVGLIAVSGGGNVTPNTAAFMPLRQLILKRGHEVVVENMIVMPSNWIVATPEPVRSELLRVYPFVVARVVNDLYKGKSIHNKVKTIDRVLSKILLAERYGAKYFGKGLQVSSSCTLCGWCIQQCPKGNIYRVNGTIHFGNACMMCLKCIYGCPLQSISAKRLKFVIIKNGYSLLEPVGDKMTLEQINHIHSRLWKGVKEYLIYCHRIEEEDTNEPHKN